MLFKNQITGETKNVSNLSMLQGRIFFTVRGKGCGARFYKNNPCVVLDEEAETGTFLKCADGWEVVNTPKERKPKSTKHEPKVKDEKVEVPTIIQPEPTPDSDAQPVVEEPVVEEQDDNVENEVTAAATDLAVGVSQDVIKNELTTKYGAMGADIFEAAMRLAGSMQKTAAVDEAKVINICEQFFAKVRHDVRVIEVHDTTTNEVRKVDGVVCADFEDMVQDVKEGNFVYMVGAAGCGKSHTAKQIAEALGLPFYPMQQLLYAHEVAGYGDAGGNYVPTPFYKAFKDGGVVFFDEFDSGSPEATLVINAAVANGRFNFPVVGTIEAHPNFRVLAAGNTFAQGADMEYTGRAVLDASTRDRMVFYEMNYERAVELPVMAGGDEELYDFVVDLRNAIKAAGIQHIVSYRATKYMSTHKDDKEKTLHRCTLKGLRKDEIRIIYGKLSNTSNKWAKSMFMMF